MRVLIADDDRVSRRLLDGALVRLGHEVVGVEDGLAAIAAAQAPDAPQLMILDVMMPGADGLAVCRALRQRPGPYVYIILLTAHGRRDNLVAGLDAGADDFLTKPFDIVELRARLRSGERVLALQDGLLRAQGELRIEATHDRLTGLWNRGMILDQLDRELERAWREQRSLAVALADLDHFKIVNDEHGHIAGDRILYEAATRMRAALREYDLMGRYGGEEFLILLPGCDLATAHMVAERARVAVGAQAVMVDGHAIPMTVSIGVTCEVSRHEPALAIQLADQALYRAKANGRNRVETSAPAPPTP